MRLLPSLTGFLLIAAFAAASAQPAPGPDQGPPSDQGPPPSQEPQSEAPGGQIAPHGGHQNFRQRFEAANITRDGRLTLQQAQAAGMKPVVRHFAEIDAGNKGYITLQDMRAWRQSRHQGRGPGPGPGPGDPQGAPPPQ